MPLLFSVLSAFLLLIAFSGSFPHFFNSGGLLIILFLAVSALLLTIRNELKYKTYILSVSGCVIACLFLILIKGVYLKNKVDTEAANHLAELKSKWKREALERSETNHP